LRRKPSSMSRPSAPSSLGSLMAPKSRDSPLLRCSQAFRSTC
jgi:hypothetical protein